MFGFPYSCRPHVPPRQLAYFRPIAIVILFKSPRPLRGIHSIVLEKFCRKHNLPCCIHCPVNNMTWTISPNQVRIHVYGCVPYWHRTVQWLPQYVTCQVFLVTSMRSVRFVRGHPGHLTFRGHLIPATSQPTPSRLVSLSLTPCLLVPGINPTWTAAHGRPA